MRFPEGGIDTDLSTSGSQNTTREGELLVWICVADTSNQKRLFPKDPDSDLNLGKRQVHDTKKICLLEQSKYCTSTNLNFCVSHSAILYWSNSIITTPPLFVLVVKSSFLLKNLDDFICSEQDLDPDSLQKFRIRSSGSSELLYFVKHV